LSNHGSSWLVGDVKITNEGTIKNLWINDKIVYQNIFLNAVAIKLANLLATRSGSIRVDAIYRADQEYGKWFVDSQMLRARYQQAVTAQDHDKADMLWARYIESRDKAVQTKNHAQSLVSN
jgi:hypothetical protein